MSTAENSKAQFRILYRQFLFRVVDLEVLSASAQGDANKLLGRFAALLIVISAAWGLGPIFIGKNISSAALAPLRLSMQQTLVATTMLTVGIFAVLSWDSIFPDRRDVFVLAPLPVRAWTMFFAKVAATGTALGLVVALLHCGAGLTWPFVFAMNSHFSSLVRGFGAYWLTMLAAGAFVYCGLLAIQGMAAQALPRRIFLRVSGFMQTGTFCLLICVYCLETPVDSLKMLTAPENQRVLSWIPTYWFMGLLARMNGSIGLLGLMLCDAALYTFRKIPFTCSYLPGKININVIIIASAFVLILVLEQIVLEEQQALHNTDTAIEMILLAGLAAAVMRWATVRARSQEGQLQFEEAEPTVMELGLYRDGAVLGNGTAK